MCLIKTDGRHPVFKAPTPEVFSVVEKRGMGATHVKICVGNNNGMINGAINIRVVPLLLLLLVPWGWVPGGWHLEWGGYPCCCWHQNGWAGSMGLAPGIG